MRWSTGLQPPYARGFEPGTERWPQSSILNMPRSIWAFDAVFARLAGDGLRIWGRGSHNHTEYDMARKHDTPITVGIDVSASSLQVAMRGVDGSVRDLEFANDGEGHRKLCQVLTKKGRPVRVCLEATGNYSLDAAIALSSTAGVEVMVVNPKSARHFAEAQLRRAKTDRVDARALLDYVERMVFVPWQRPDQAVIHLRQLGRRISALIEAQTAEKNRLAASQATGETPRAVADDIHEAIQQLEVRISKLETEALALIARTPSLTAGHTSVISIKGVGDRTAIRILGELMPLAHDMSPREIVAHAGLDPRPRQSGSRDGKRQISRVGNARLRAALFMPALAAVRFEPAIRDFYQSLLQRNKLKMVALVAVMRRMLAAIWAMLLNDSTFDPARFAPKGNQARISAPAP